MRVAAVDCGTNSIRLLIADAHDGRLVDVTRRLRIVRLGQDVDHTGLLAPEALARTEAALADYAALVRESGAERLRLVATSATRDARNRSDFVAMVQRTLGIEPEVVSGQEEARLTFAGAVAGLPGAAEPVLVADIGGGSTELVLGGGGIDLAAHSMDIGSVRLTERRFATDPPTSRHIAAALADVDAALAQVAVPITEAATFVGVAGTVTTLAGIALGLPEYDSAAIHGAVLTAARIEELTTSLLTLPHDARAALPTMHPGRVDVIAAGALILRRLVQMSGARQLIVSEHDILDGIAARLAAD